MLPGLCFSQAMFMQRFKLANNDSVTLNVSEVRAAYENSNGTIRLIYGYPNSTVDTKTDFDDAVSNSCGNLVIVTAKQQGIAKRMAFNPQWVYRVYRSGNITRILLRETNQIFDCTGTYELVSSLLDNCLAGNALNGGSGVTIIGDSIFVADTDSLNELQYLDTAMLVGYDLMLSLYKDSIPASVIDLSPLIDSAQVIADSIHTLYNANDTIPHGRVATMTGSLTFDGSGIVSGDRQFTVPIGSVSNGGQARVLARRGTTSVVRAEIAYETDSALTQVRVFRNGILLSTSPTDTFSRVDVSGPVAFTAIESYPPLLVASSPYNDYGPPLSGHTNVVQLTSDAVGVEITGWKYGIQGRLLVVHNPGLYPITLLDDDAGSAAGNRFDFGADYVLEKDGAVMMQYIGTDWRVVGSFSGSASEDLNGIYTGSGNVGQAAANVMASIDSTYEFGLGRLSSFPSTSSGYKGDYGIHINGDGGFGLQGKRLEILSGYYDRTKASRFVYSGDGASGTVNWRIGLTSLSNTYSFSGTPIGFNNSIIHAYGKFDEIQIGAEKVTPGAGNPGDFRDFAYMYHGYGRSGTDTIPLSMFLGFPQSTDTTAATEKSYGNFRGWAIQSHVQTGALTGSRAFNHIMVNAGTGVVDTGGNTVGLYKSKVGGNGYYLPNTSPSESGCDTCIWVITGIGDSDAETFMIDKSAFGNNENIYTKDDLLKAGGTTVGLDSGSLKLNIPNAAAIRYGLQVIGNTANTANRFFVAKTEADSMWIQESGVGYTIASFLRNLRLQSSEIMEVLADSIDIIEGTIQTKDSVHYLIGKTENGILKRIEGGADDDILVWNGETWAAEAISGFISAAVSIPSTEIAFGTGTGITSSSALKYVSPLLSNQVASAAVAINDTGASSTTSGGLLTLANYDNAALSSGHRAGIIQFYGQTNGSGGTASGGSIILTARGNWSGTSAPGTMTFATTNVGSTTPHEKFRLTSNALGNTYRAEFRDRTTVDLYNTGNTDNARIEVGDSTLYLIPTGVAANKHEIAIYGKLGVALGAGVTIAADMDDLYLASAGGVVEMAATGSARTVSGMQPSMIASGVCRLLIVYNSGSFDITFLDEDAGSSATNRFSLEGSDYTLVPDALVIFVYKGDRWFIPNKPGSASSPTAHGTLTGLSNDDHTQYLLLDGRSGGQVATGGTGSGDDITIRSTSNATKGDVIIADQGGNVTVGGGATASEVRLYEPSGSGTNYTAVKVGAQAGNVTYTVPASAPSVDGLVLSSTTAGVQSWVSSGAVAGIIRPTTIAATTNDYTPTGYSTSLPQTIEITGDASFRTITGLAAATRDNVFKVISNTGTNCYILAKSHTGSSAANRFKFSKDLVMLPNMEATIRYDSVNAYWRLVSINKDNVDFANLARLDFRENGGSVTSGDSDMWNWTTSGGSITNSAPAGSTTNMRAATLSSSVATAFPNMSAKQTMIWLSANNSYIRCSWRIATPSALSTAAEDYDLRFGFKGTVDTNYTEGAYISYERQENSGGWTIKTHDGSSPTTTNAGSAIATSTYYNLEIIYYPYGEVVAFIDGTRYATTSTLPTDLAVVPFAILDTDRRTSGSWTIRIVDFNCDFVNVK